MLACEPPTAPPIDAGTSLELVTSGLRVLDPARDGAYEAWVIDGQGQANRPGGRTHWTRDAHDSGRRRVRTFEITVEPPVTPTISRPSNDCCAAHSSDGSPSSRSRAR